MLDALAALQPGDDLLFLAVQLRRDDRKIDEPIISLAS